MIIPSIIFEALVVMCRSVSDAVIVVIVAAAVIVRFLVSLVFSITLSLKSLWA